MALLYATKHCSIFKLITAIFLDQFFTNIFIVIQTIPIYKIYEVGFMTLQDYFTHFKPCQPSKILVKKQSNLQFQLPWDSMPK